MAASAGAAAPTLTATVTAVAHSTAHASLLAIYQWYDPPKTFPARTMPEAQISKALADAIVTYGLTDASAWLTDNGCISTNKDLLPKGVK